jgi:uncharacterized Ntn-hydrolase superfamily protein
VTFSIVAHCPRTGAFGMAISSSSPAVAARCAHARAGVGVVASQNITDPRLGPRGLDLAASGLDAEAIVAKLSTDAHSRFRQIAVVDRAGRAAVFSGSRTLGVHGAVQRGSVAAAGNLLRSQAVPAAMLEAFEASEGALAERLLTSLEAGLAAGGEAGPVRSAGLLVVREVAWPIIDLRVDWRETPILALRELWEIYAPEVENYVRRALAPDDAPSFGVPGDE